MARLVIGVLALLAACGDGGTGGSGAVPAATPASHDAELVAELAVARAGCARCHEPSKETASRLAPIRGPGLAEAAGWHARDWSESFLVRHHAGDAAADVAAYVASLAPVRELEVMPTSPATLEHGERLFGELACGTCHAPDALAKLATRTDHTHVAGFLRDPSAHRPFVVHDFGLSDGEASALAAWLLRLQVRDDGKVRVPGFAYECFEFEIEGGDLPDLEGKAAKSSGLVAVIDVEARTRQTNFAMRFRASIDVPAAGDWKFTVGSDDGSWLWIDGEQIVENGGMKPHRKKSGKVQLDAGPHDLLVVYTQGGGGKSLEVLWEGPGTEQQPIPADRANAATMLLQPPAVGSAPDPQAIARGRAAVAQKRCIACHDIVDPELASEPVESASPWAELGAGSCPESPAAAALHGPARAGLARALDDHARLSLALRRDQCLSCHVRDGEGGLPAAVREHLVETEDLGEEGLQPPDLSRVGHRLRQEWIEKVLAEGHRARTYVRVRMPKVSSERAKEYAELFARVDGADTVDDEPAFSVAAVELGQKMAGINGRNCVTCHSFAGTSSTGVQGMDLAIQHERVRPQWFREWLLKAPVLRPGTRMPMFWPEGSEADLREIEALRSWLALGASAPIPEGLVPEAGSLVLLPGERPVLHGAFLDGVSARCIAVGTQHRTNYAFDVSRARLSWIWRGAFLDATGTWHGRAGKLLKPLGADWLVVDDFDVTGAAKREVLGHRIDAAGYPTFVVRAGQVEYDDTTRPRLAASGTELVRTLRCTKGTLAIEWPTSEGVRMTVAGQPVGATSQLARGEEIEVVYQW